MPNQGYIRNKGCGNVAKTKFQQKRAKIDDFTTLRKRMVTKKVLNIRQKRDFSIFSRFLRRQMKSDMVVMPNQFNIRN